VRLTKFFLFLFLFFSYTLCCFSCIFLEKTSRLRLISKITSFFSSLLLKVLGVHIKVRGNLSSKKLKLIVSNHVSYLDILIIAKLIPSIFVTSTDVENEFFTGFLSKIGGSIFINRRLLKRIHREILEIAKVIVHSCPVCLFPEATSSDGKTVLPFKSTFFEVAKKVSIHVQPVCLKYSDSRVCYYGDMKFFNHFWKLLKIKRIDVQIFILEYVSNIENTRHEMSNIAHSRILKAFNGEETCKDFQRFIAGNWNLRTF